MTKYFLIVSNVRCGSTYLQGLLSEIPGSVTEYEIKPPRDSQNPVHFIVGRNGVSLKSLFKKLETPSANLVGSKITFDAKALTSVDYELILKFIDVKEVKIIHLTRSIKELIPSILRGYKFKINKNNNALETKLKDTQYAKDILLSANNKNSARVASVSEVRDMCLALENHTNWVNKNLVGFDILNVPYSEIANRFHDILIHLRIDPKLVDYKKIISNPQILKNDPISLHDIYGDKSVEYEDIINNFRE